MVRVGCRRLRSGWHGVGLSTLPFVGMGHLDWVAAGRGLESQSLLKPSPVHTLAALRLAAGDSLGDALLAAAGLELDRVDDGRWDRLDAAKAIVFEARSAGCRAQAALNVRCRASGFDWSLICAG